MRAPGLASPLLSLFADGGSETENHPKLPRWLAMGGTGLERKLLHGSILRLLSLPTRLCCEEWGFFGCVELWDVMNI